jgi:acetyl esterase/lipase
MWIPSGFPGVVSARDLIFHKVDGRELRLDLHRPARDERPLPLVLYLHGGGWRVGTRTDREAERLLPLAAAGFTVASIDYRLSDTAIFPAPLDDARIALRWLRGKAGRLAIDPARVAVAGASAGAHLATLLALSARAPEDQVSAVVAWFPVIDLVGWDREWRNAPFPSAGSFAARGAARRGWPPVERAAALLGVDHVENAPPERLVAADPLSHLRDVGAAAPPFLILHGDVDSAVDVRHARLLHDGLKAAGARSTLLVLADADHEDPAFGGPAALGAVSGFLKSALAGRPAASDVIHELALDIGALGELGERGALEDGGDGIADLDHQTAHNA